MIAGSFYDFAADPKVHDTVLWTMVITSFLAAIRRFKDDTIKAQTRAWIRALMLFWNFLYDWAIGFWSMRTGQPIKTTTQQLETHTPSGDTLKLTSSTETPSFTPPPPQPAGPAQPTK